MAASCAAAAAAVTPGVTGYTHLFLLLLVLLLLRIRNLRLLLPWRPIMNSSSAMDIGTTTVCFHIIRNLETMHD